MNTPKLSYPRAPQIAANPKDAEHYIKSQAEEIERLRGVIAEASTKLKLLYMSAGLGQTTGRAALDALNAEIAKLDARHPR